MQNLKQKFSMAFFVGTFSYSQKRDYSTTLFFKMTDLTSYRTFLLYIFLPTLYT